MRKLVCTLTVIGLLLSTARGARAEALKGEAHAGLLAAQNACFAMLVVTEIVNSQFNGQEKLEVDGETVATWSPLVGRAQSIPPGTAILFASLAAAAASGLTADIVLSDAVCAKFRAGAILRFIGSFGAVMATLTLPPAFALQHVYANGTLIQLAIATFVLRSMTGMATLGTLGGGGDNNPVAGSTTGGCSVAAGRAPGTGLAALLAVALPAAALALRRKRRARAATA